MFAFSTIRLHQALVAAAILIPAAAFVAAAVENRNDVRREGEGVVLRTAAVLDEHARKVFDTVDLVLGRVEDRVRSLPDGEIARDETSIFLRDLKAPLRQAVSIWVSDRLGNLLAGSQSWDHVIDLKDRDFFSVHKVGSRDTYISPAFVGRATNIASFAVSRARLTPEGVFNGVLHVALSPDYFASFFREASPELSHTALLFREDGAVLARDPTTGPVTQLAPDSPFMRAVAAQRDGGSFRGPSPIDGVSGFYAYRRAAPFNIYVAFGQSEQALVDNWYDNLRLYGAVAGAAALFLLALSLLALQRVRAAEEALRLLTIQSDQRLAAEQSLFQSQKMESLGQLTGGIAHDFNNLLTVVLGNLSMMEKHIKGNERAERLLERSILGAERGAALTQRLLAFARRQELAPKSVDVAALLHGVEDMLRTTLGASIEIVIDIPRQVAPALVDPNQLELAILNLAVNARDAMPYGGRMVVSVSGVALAQGNDLGVPAGDYICLALSDTGCGMDEDTRARASEPFFTTKDVGKGTGLGLSMVHGLAAQSGGCFRLQSKVGEGTRAEIWLPRSAKSALASTCPTSDVTPPATARILLVDDDDLVRQSTAALLEERGYEIVQAADGKTALEVLAAHDFDLLITDLVMPGMSGAMLSSKALEARPDLPVLVISGHAERAGDVPPHLLRLGKPFSEDDLFASIAHLLVSRHASTAV